jgi:hypothetical protein
MSRPWKIFGVLALSLMACAGPAAAGKVTLEPREVRALRDLVAQDKRAAARFAEIKRLADDALDDRPNPIRLLVSEGRLPTDPERIRSRQSLEDVRKIDALAWTWAVTDDERYAKKARQIILAWADLNHSDGNPINETGLEPLVEAYDLLRPAYPAAEREFIDEWLRERALKTWENPRVRRENWQSHRLKMVGLIGATIEDPALWRIADRAFREQIRENFSANGESVDFRRRDALHYHLYAVHPLLVLACVGERRGERLFAYAAPNGASLERAVEFMRPFSTGEKKHVEFAKSEVQFDKSRAAAGDSEYGERVWNPKAAVRTYSEAACVKPAYADMAASIAGTPGNPYVDWRAVVNAAAVRAR